jgi:transcription-repair coupling factor (superfamily II helicase)
LAATRSLDNLVCCWGVPELKLFSRAGRRISDGSDGFDVREAILQVFPGPRHRTATAGIVKLFAGRMTVLRECCPKDNGRHLEFGSRFPFKPTPDQIKAFAEVADDMIGKPLPMDRLIYGDTGCGKTEVAMRAIHRACCAGRQVVVLAPTTVLAAHWKRELDKRMLSEWTIALFSSQE